MAMQLTPPPEPQVAAAELGQSPKPGNPVLKCLAQPLSLQEPTAADEALNEQMLRDLEVEFPAESSDGMAKRQELLRIIEQMIKEWAADFGVESGLAEEEVKQLSVKITTLGSYRLGLVHPGSDIDTLCIGPPTLQREHFFASFVQKLHQNESITECVPIPEAYTPIIKLKIRGICIDLLFARLAKPLGEGENLEDVVKADEVLRNMDEKSVRCVNGFRVADQILKLVPKKETFRTTLRFIKFWARKRGIYSNVLGFFGGITWSLLVARVCQLFPNFTPSQLVSRFFWLYNKWTWPKPVMLCDVVDYHNVPGMTSFKVWNPWTDWQHLMPVITPAFPAMNSAYNVTETTKRIMLDEFKRGFEVVQNVEAKKMSWNEVHEPFPFFTYFSHFLWLEVLVKTDEVYTKYSGWVESKLRVLVKELEHVPGLLVHPNPMQYDLCGSNSEWPLGCSMFLAISFSEGVGAFPRQMVDLRPAYWQFFEVINQWSDRETYAGQFDLRLRRIHRSQIPEHVRNPEGARQRPYKKRRSAGPPVAPLPLAAKRLAVGPTVVTTVL